MENAKKIHGHTNVGELKFLQEFAKQVPKGELLLRSEVFAGNLLALCVK
jgi:hypothetical protein